MSRDAYSREGEIVLQPPAIPGPPGPPGPTGPAGPGSFQASAVAERTLGPFIFQGPRIGVGGLQLGATLQVAVHPLIPVDLVNVWGFDIGYNDGAGNFVTVLAAPPVSFEVLGLAADTLQAVATNASPLIPAGSILQVVPAIKAGAPTQTTLTAFYV